MILTLNRPALIQSDEQRLDAEYRSARWLHHKLLDFEDAHQRILDAAAEAAAPGIGRIGRILARLARRAWRASRSSPGTWCPNPRPELATRLKARLADLRELRNADPGWKAALGWADEQVGEPIAVRRRRAKDPSKIKRRKKETDETWAKRFALLTTDETEEHYAEKLAKAPRRTRRDQYRIDLYAQRWCYWGTWNTLLKSVDQARTDVLKLRALGLPAEWRRPKYRDPISLSVDEGMRIVERPTRQKLGISSQNLRSLPKNERKRIYKEHAKKHGLYWIIQIRIGITEEWVTFRAKCNNWHQIPDDVAIKTAKLTRRKDGERWRYSVSLVMRGVKKRAVKWATDGKVSFDWGHREHGHDQERDGLRAFVWRGDDGQRGEVIVPIECRRAQDEIDEMKARMDQAFNARKLPDRNRYTYRRRLMRDGVRTEEETLWLRWEMRYERRIEARRRYIRDLREETYLKIVRELRTKYATFAFEDERVHDPTHKRYSIRELETDDQMPRRRRANRDLCARYEFVEICERFGAEITTVSARNTTRECPTCGELGENGPELLTVCMKCGTARDKDHGAAEVILRRTEAALENRDL